MKRVALLLSVLAFSLAACQKAAEAPKADPAKAEAKPGEPAKPADAAKPADPAAKPADAAKAADPAAKPAEAEKPADAAKPADAEKPADPAAKPADAPKADNAAEQPKPADAPAAEKPAAEAENPKGDNDMVVFETSMGTFKVKLYPEKTPITVKNFLQYVDEKFYDGLIFHRVVPGFVIQGGGFTPDLQKKNTREPIANEAKLGIPNKKYTLSMARTQVRDSATSQFFVSLEDNAMLDYSGESPRGWGYAAFGEVVEGMDVIDRIGAVETGPAGPFPGEVPTTTVVILKAYRVPAGK